MGALRKAGVWLGLVEDDEDRGYDDRSYRGYGDDYGDEDEVDEIPVPPRARLAERTVDRTESLRGESLRSESLRGESLRGDSMRGDSMRGESLRTERTTVRSITRPTSTASYPTRENLAVAPRTAVAERATQAEEDDRRYQITTLHPTTYNEARTIGEHFRDNVPVIMNLTEMD